MSSTPSSITPARTAYPSDVSDEEWAFVVPYLVLLAEDAEQRRYALREVFNGLRYLVRTGAHWRMMPHDLPPWQVVYQRYRRWLAAGSFETLVADLRGLLRLEKGRGMQPTAAILDSRIVQSTPESGAPGRAGYDGHKRRKGAKVHAAVDTLGHLLALHVTPANAQDRTQVETLAAQIQAVTGDHIELAYVDQGYTGEQPATAAAAHGLHLEVVKLPEEAGPKRGFVLLPRRWMVERGFAWAARFRRLARDYERLPGARLRAPARRAGRPALRRLRLPDAHPIHPVGSLDVKSITGSRDPVRHVHWVVSRVLSSRLAAVIHRSHGMRRLTPTNDVHTTLMKPFHCG